MSDHNAWLLLPENFKKLLGRVYKRNTGEIWLYNYDLFVFRDKKLFNELYSGIIDKPPLNEKIRCIKILLSNERLAELKNKKSIIYKNLCNLSAKRLKTFYVGTLPDKPKKITKDLGDNPWIFYTVDGSLLSIASNRGTVLVRHKEYPFVIKDDHAHKLAVCWQLQDKTAETGIIKERIAQVFNNWFKNYQHFESIEPITNENGKVTSLKFIPPRDEKKIEKIWNDEKTTKQNLPITTGIEVDVVDFGIVTALEDEATAIEEKLNSSVVVEKNKQLYRLGYYCTGSGVIYSVAVCRHVNMGSVPSALVTADLINQFNPKHVVLLGIAAGLPEIKPITGNKKDNLQKGDVVYATAISPYEYKKYKEIIDENGSESSHKNASQKREVTREDRTRPCTQFLIELADLVAKEWKSTMRHKIDTVTPEEEMRAYSLAFGGVVASGCKVIADSTTMNEIAEAEKQLNRKLIALEMEGEGVAEAATRKNTPFILIKGISDMGNTKKNDEWHIYAAQQSVKFFINMLDNYPTEES